MVLLNSVAWATGSLRTDSLAQMTANWLLCSGQFLKTVVPARKVNVYAVTWWYYAHGSVVEMDELDRLLSNPGEQQADRKEELWAIVERLERIAGS